jgi:hypothetical protein
MDNFDLRKYLVENKATTNSRMIKESFTPTGDKGFDNFAKEVAEIIWSTGLEDPFAAEFTDWDSIFETWEEQGDLDQYTQSDIVSMAEEAGVSQDDIDYILDLPQVSKLESGEISERKHSKMMKENEAPEYEVEDYRGDFNALQDEYLTSEMLDTAEWMVTQGMDPEEAEELADGGLEGAWGAIQDVTGKKYPHIYTFLVDDMWVGAEDVFDVGDGYIAMVEDYTESFGVYPRAAFEKFKQALLGE